MLLVAIVCHVDSSFLLLTKPREVLADACQKIRGATRHIGKGEDALKLPCCRLPAAQAELSCPALASEANISAASCMHCSWNAPGVLFYADPRN